jgi:hypothetical protein
MVRFLRGDRIFLQSFVLRRFSMIQKRQRPEGQLASLFALGSNLSRLTECDKT